MTESLPVSYNDIKAAAKRVHQEIIPTPVTYSPFLSEFVQHAVYIKWENRHRTGSFKERGVVNFLGSLSADERKRGVCAASAGNHALALSWYAKKNGIPCSVIMPKGAPLIKIQSTMQNGAKVILEGATFDEAYQNALKLAKDEGYVFVSGFDDERIIAGHGTAGYELLDQLSDFDSLIIPMGGGGLIAGSAIAVKEKRPDVHIMAVQSEWIVEARKHVSEGKPKGIMPTSIADGIAVKTVGKLTGMIVDKIVDQIAVLNEQEIAFAIMKLLELEKTVVEGAGAAGVGALLARKLPSHFKKTAVIVSGSNIDLNVLSRLIGRDMGERNRLLRINTSVPDRPGSLSYITGVLATNGANIMEVIHDRAFTRVPGNVAITFLLEVRDSEHKQVIIKALEEVGIETSEI